METVKKPRNNQKFMAEYDVKSISEINSSELNVSVCNLPIDYIQIVGIKNGSYEIAFDLDHQRVYVLYVTLKRYEQECQMNIIAIVSSFV